MKHAVETKLGNFIALCKIFENQIFKNETIIEIKIIKMVKIKHLEFSK